MRIFVWGRGVAAEELLENELSSTTIAGFIDNNKESSDKNVFAPYEVVKERYDAIIVATAHSQEIYQQAEKMSFDMSKFIFVYNNRLYKDMNQNYELVAKIFPQGYSEIIKNRYHMIRGMKQDEVRKSAFDPDRTKGMYASDYNRIRTFELIADEICEASVEGAVAELGVFRGEFARYINERFPERKCYLFDTFEGFRKSEAFTERAAGNCGEMFIERFRNTSEEYVISRMIYPQNVVCKKGLFPESLDKLEERFAFVSIDVDFQQSIYDGLSYFYPRLNAGGYIFVHDYNSVKLKGVKAAIQMYEQKNGIRIAKVPIPDLEGTIVLTK